MTIVPKIRCGVCGQRVRRKRNSICSDHNVVVAGDDPLHRRRCLGSGSFGFPLPPPQEP